jgi:hypothetical protein
MARTVMNIRRNIRRSKLGAVPLTLILMAWPYGPAAGSARGASLEYQLRAAFLLNFSRYIEWPGKSGGTSELSLCVVGPDVFGTALDDVAANRVVNGRQIVIRKDVSAAGALSCNMVYLSLMETSEIRKTLKILESSNVLTVGEGAAFARMGGMIAFTESDGKIRFYINASAADRAGITISSRLLVMAKSVRDERERRR